jgi:septum formation protein
MGKQPAHLVLASTSRYRRSLLKRLQIPFDVAAPGVDEAHRQAEAPADLALRLSAEKALAVSLQQPSACVIGSDQVAALGAQLLGKPGTTERAEAQLAMCSGQTVIFYTAISLAVGGRLVDQRLKESIVEFRALSPAQIRDYVAREQPLDCAGSFRWEGLGICLFRALKSDDPTALEGLPLISLSEMLQNQGFSFLNSDS